MKTTPQPKYYKQHHGHNPESLRAVGIATVEMSRWGGDKLKKQQQRQTCWRKIGNFDPSVELCRRVAEFILCFRTKVPWNNKKITFDSFISRLCSLQRNPLSLFNISLHGKCSHLTFQQTAVNSVSDVAVTVLKVGWYKKFTWLQQTRTFTRRPVVDIVTVVYSS